MKSSKTTRPANALIVLATSAAFSIPAIGWAQDVSDNLQYIILSDDIRKQVSNVERPDGADASTPPAAPNGSDAGDGNGNGNNGHGNNADGVDSSNPGQGKGGPNGGVDPSGDVDDEAGGGGAAPSKGKGKK